MCDAVYAVDVTARCNIWFDEDGFIPSLFVCGKGGFMEYIFFVNNGVDEYFKEFEYWSARVEQRAA